jgi:hypothetical protein
MADRIIKGDSGNDVIIQNNDGSRKIEVTNSGDVEVTGDFKATTVKATNLKANDGTAGLVVADSTGEVTSSGGLKATNVKTTNLKANDGTAGLAVADSTGEVTSSGGLKATNVKTTNLKANDGTASLAVADSTGQVTASAKIDLNGNELILDADADTSITADTDDRIDFRVSGSDKFQIMSDGAIQYQGTDHGKMIIETGQSGGTAVASNHDFTVETDTRNIECMAYRSLSSGGFMSARYAIVSCDANGTGASVNEIYSIGGSGESGVKPVFSKTNGTTFRVAFQASTGSNYTPVHYYIRVIIS